MTTQLQSFDFEQIIDAAPSQVFFAFSNATALKEWLCDVATLSPKVGGRIYLAWNSGYYTSGEFISFKPDHKIAFSWSGRGEPEATLVEVLLSPKGEATLVHLTHKNLGSDAEWEYMVQEVKQGWQNSLENLASVLETGADLRVLSRPMLGIINAEFDSKIAEQLDIPVKEGIRLDNVVEGFGAHTAGLRKDDVIVGIGGKPVTDYPSLAAALNGRRAGDEVIVDFYRGPQINSVAMKLTGRPIPELPVTIEALANIIKKRYEGLEINLDSVLTGINDTEAAYKPSDDEWSVKEVLAHMIHSERDGQAYLSQMLAGQVNWADDYAGNDSPRIQATLSAFPTVNELQQELKHLFAESTALYSNIPLDFPIKRRGTFWGMAFFAVQPPYHEIGHYEQIKTTIDAARA